MSDELSHFIPDQFSEGPPGKSRGFDLDEHVRDAQALKSGFVHDLEDQRNIADSNVLKAKEGVKEIFSDAMQKMKDQAAKIQEESREKGFEEGHEEGYQAGAAAVKDRFASSLEALESLVAELSEARKKMYPLMEREMVEMVTTLARKVVRQELESKADGIREIVRMAIESVIDRESLIVKVNPDDYKELGDYGQELIQLFHEIKNVEIESHVSVPRGNCVVESNFGTIAAGLDHLDEHIERILHLAPPAPPPPVILDEPEAPSQDKVEEPPVDTREPGEPEIIVDELPEPGEVEPEAPSQDKVEEPPVDTLEPDEPEIIVDELPEPEEVEPEAPSQDKLEEPPVDILEPDEPDKADEPQDLPESNEPMDPDAPEETVQLSEPLETEESPEPDEPLATDEPLDQDDIDEPDEPVEPLESDNPDESDESFELDEPDEPFELDDPETSD